MTSTLQHFQRPRIKNHGSSGLVGTGTLLWMIYSLHCVPCLSTAKTKNCCIVNIKLFESAYGTWCDVMNLPAFSVVKGVSEYVIWLNAALICSYVCFCSTEYTEVIHFGFDMFSSYNWLYVSAFYFLFQTLAAILMKKKDTAMHRAAWRTRRLCSAAVRYRPAWTCLRPNKTFSVCAPSKSVSSWKWGTHT